MNIGTIMQNQIYVVQNYVRGMQTCCEESKGNKKVCNKTQD